MRQTAFRFVLLIGILSFFADFVYEGARSILGPYLASLNASAFVVGTVLGLGELLGYGLRFISGRLADATQRFWPITIAGYVVQMASVPLLSFTGTWQAAAVLIIMERVGKATRNPPRDVMLSHAAQHIGGYGWAFGLHEALDQFGAMLGPLAMAAILAHHGSYHQAFAVLVIPAVINVSLVIAARLIYPNPEHMELHKEAEHPEGKFPKVFWVYMIGAMLIALGFADYGLIAYHFAKMHVITLTWIPVLYAVAMAVSGASSLFFGRLFDRYGFPVLVAATVFTMLFAPLVFFGGFWLALLGAAVWGMGMGAHETMIPAAVTPMVPQKRRASAFGLFTAAYGAAWFVGSAAIGALYDVSLQYTVAFCVVTQLAAVPLLAWVAGRTGASNKPQASA